VGALKRVPGVRMGDGRRPTATQRIAVHLQRRARLRIAGDRTAVNAEAHGLTGDLNSGVGRNPAAAPSVRSIADWEPRSRRRTQEG